MEQCIANWMRIPRALFGKAWIVTGHITAEDLFATSDITQSDLDNCELLTDPLSLESVLGVDNAEGPSVEDLVRGGAQKRCRVVWSLGGKPNSPVSHTALLPGALIYPVEKHLANYLYLKAVLRNLHKRLRNM